MEKQKITNLELWNKFKNEKNERKRCELKNKLIEIYYPLVQKISYKVAKNLCWNVQPEELASFGIDGLYTAIDRFLLDMGVDFPAYANRRISGSMIDGVRKEDIIPRNVRVNNNLLENTRLKLEKKNSRRVTEFEVIEHLGISQTEYLKNIKKYKPTGFISIDGTNICSSSKQEEYKQDNMSNFIDRKTISPDSEILKKEFLNKLISKNFSLLEQKIIHYYYYDNLTMREISKKINISESRISQIHSKVIPRLRNKIKRNPVFFENRVKKDYNDTNPLF